MTPADTPTRMRRLHEEPSFSLAQAALAPPGRYAVSAAMLATQALLLYSQTQYFWRIDLFLDLIHASLDPAWAALLSNPLSSNALTDLCGAEATQQQCAFNASDRHHYMLSRNEEICLPMHCPYTFTLRLLDYTFMDSVRGLWQGGTQMLQFSGAVVFLFSGVWPHLKLVLLQLCWWLPMRPSDRRRRSFLLTNLGKFSLMDIYVVCCMMVVFSMPGEVPLHSELNDLKRAFTAFCSGCARQGWTGPIDLFKGILGTCTRDTAIPCGALRGLVMGVDAHGTFGFNLSIQSHAGIILFCLGVFGSIALSEVVEMFEARVEADQMGGSIVHMGSRYAPCYSWEFGGGSPPAHGVLASCKDDAAAAAAAAVTTASAAATNAAANAANATGPAASSSLPTKSSARRSETTSTATATATGTATGTASGTATAAARLHECLSLALLPLVLVALLLPFASRELHGSLPVFLHKAGLDFDGRYSVMTMVPVIGQAGGADLWLMFNFMAFCILFPLAYAISLLLLQLPPRVLRSLLPRGGDARGLKWVLARSAALASPDVLLCAALLVSASMADISENLLVSRAKHAASGSKTRPWRHLCVGPVAGERLWWPPLCWRPAACRLTAHERTRGLLHLLPLPGSAGTRSGSATCSAPTQSRRASPRRTACRCAMCCRRSTVAFVSGWAWSSSRASSAWRQSRCCLRCCALVTTAWKHTTVATATTMTTQSESCSP